MDIFETLRSMLGCMYISDLKFGTYKEKAIELLKEIQLDDTQKADIYQYLEIGVIL